MGETTQSALQSIVKAMVDLGYVRSNQVFDTTTEGHGTIPKRFRLRPGSFAGAVVSGARCFDTTRSWEIEVQFLPGSQIPAVALEKEVLPEEDRIVDQLMKLEISFRISGQYQAASSGGYTTILITLETKYDRTMS